MEDKRVRYEWRGNFYYEIRSWEDETDPGSQIWPGYRFLGQIYKVEDRWEWHSWSFHASGNRVGSQQSGQASSEEEAKEAVIKWLEQNYTMEMRNIPLEYQLERGGDFA